MSNGPGKREFIGDLHKTGFFQSLGSVSGKCGYRVKKHEAETIDNLLKNISCDEEQRNGQSIESDVNSMKV